MMLPEEFDFAAADRITADLVTVIREHAHDPVNLSLALLRMSAVIACASGKPLTLDCYTEFVRLTFYAAGDHDGCSQRVH